jgi:hypothetical protein
MNGGMGPGAGPSLPQAQPQGGGDAGSMQALIEAMMGRGMSYQQAIMAVQEMIQGPQPMPPSGGLQPQEMTQGIGLGR